MNVQEQANVKVTLNNEEAKREMDELNGRIEKMIQLRKKAEKAGDVKGFKKIDQELKKAQREAKRYEKQLYDVDKALRNINGASWNELKKAEAALVAQTRKLNRETTEYTNKRAQLKQVRAEISRINATQRTSASMWSRMSDGFNRYFGMATAWLASIAGATFKAKQAVDGFFNREDMVGKVKSLTKLAGEELDFLEQKAIEFSTTTTKEGIKIQKSADEILEAFQLVGSAKPELLKNKEALAQVTREILIQSEAAEGMALTDAIDATTKAMNQYSAGAEQAARFTNAMAAGAQVGAVQIPEIGESMKEFGTNANAANVPVERSVGLIELVGEKAGLVGPRAGVQLRNFFTILSAGADETNPEMVGLSESLDKLAEKNMSSAEYVQLFGRENANVARIIVQNRTYLDELTDAITGTNTAYTQAIDNTVDQKAALTQARNRAHEYAVELGEQLAPAMIYIADSGSLILKFLTASVKLFVQSRGIIIPLTASIIGYKTAIKLAALWQATYNKESKISLALIKMKVFWHRAEKGALLLVSAAQALLTGNIKRATAAMRIFNRTTKMSPLGLFIGLATAAATAFLVFRDNSVKAASGQKKLNDEIERGNELASQSQTLEERASITENLSKQQLENLKSDLKSQISMEENFHATLLGKLKKRLSEDEQLQVLSARRNQKGLSQILKINIGAQIEARKRAIARDLEEESKGNKQRLQQLRSYLSRVNTELGKRPGETTDDEASNALELAHKEQILRIKQYYADKEELQKESQARLLAADLAYLMAKANLETDEEKRLELQSQIIDKQLEYNKALKEAVPEIINTDDAVDKLNTRLLEQGKLMGYASQKQREATDDQEELTARQVQQAQTIQMVGDVMTDYVTGALNGTMDEYANFGDTLILMSLQILKQMVPIWSAQILGYSLASFESVATWGAAGVAKHAAISALMYAAISAVEGGVRKGIENRREAATQHATGKYPIMGASDGRMYDTNFAGRPKTGLYSGPQLGIFNEVPGEPEMVVDGKTTRQLMINYPAVYDGIRQMAAGFQPQFANGKYPTQSNPVQPYTPDPTFSRLLSDNLKATRQMTEAAEKLWKDGTYTRLLGRDGLIKQEAEYQKMKSNVTL